VIDNLQTFKWWEIVGTHKYAQEKLIKDSYQKKLLQGNVDGDLLNIAYEFGLSRPLLGVKKK
jgi:hypothetical protein